MTRSSNGVSLTASTTDTALLQLLENDVRRGWYKLALRHSMMLERLGASVPIYLAAYCEAARQRCTQRDIEQIEHAVNTWMSMTLSCKTPWDFAPQAGFIH